MVSQSQELVAVVLAVDQVVVTTVVELLMDAMLVVTHKDLVKD